MSLPPPQVDFRRLLLNHCQVEFEKGTQAMKAVQEREQEEAAEVGGWLEGLGSWPTSRVSGQAGDTGSVGMGEGVGGGTTNRPASSSHLLLPLPLPP